MSVKYSSIVIVITISVIIITGFLLPTIAYGQLPYLPNLGLSENQGNQDRVITANESNNSILSNADDTSGNRPKVVIINFDDSHKSEYTYAKPILDKYGFKATFFEVCGWITSEEGWREIAELQQDGMDIESHTITHPDLGKLSEAQLTYEIGQSRQCFLSHGINTRIFAYPFGQAANNATILDTVSKYYDLARSNGYYDLAIPDDNDFPLALLQCDGSNGYPQNGCRAYSSDVDLNFPDRYSIISWAHVHIQGDYSDAGVCVGICYSYDNSQMLDRFITAVNSQNNYNNDGIIRAIPIIVYHGLATYADISDSKIPVETTVNLFEAEMKYLHDNGFRALTMADLGYDENSNHLYIKK
jgi:peptidoglycan/xylan/chitin deacetylase (PgdA/CDA1 family)